LKVIFEFEPSEIRADSAHQERRRARFHPPIAWHVCGPHLGQQVL